jgi:predicted kinase
MAQSNKGLSGLRVLVCAGPPLSGKSTVAKALAAKKDWSHIEVDSVLSLLMPSSNRCLEHRKLGYRAAHKLAGVLLEFGRNVVIDCTYSRVFYRQDLVSAVNQADGSLYLAEFHVGREIALSRFENRRGHPAVDLTGDRVSDLAVAYPYANSGLSIDLSVIDVEEAIENISHLISDANPLDGGLWISSGIPDLID